MTGSPANAHLVRDRIQHLHSLSSAGRAHKILRPIVYKLFGAFVDYDPEYQGLEEVLLDTNMLEATASVRFCSNGGDFACNPYWIDSFLHLSGFILNGTEFTPPDSVFISHGWRSFEVMDSLSQEKTYHSYVRMRQDSCRNMFSGDVYLLEGDRIVAICQDLKFQQIRRDVLDLVIPNPKLCVRLPKSHDYESSSAVGSSAMTEAKPDQRMPTAEGPIHTTFEQVLAIIAEELGTVSTEIDEDSDLVALGVDSLMITSILAALADRIGTRLPASVFIECRNVRDLRALLSANPDHLATSVEMGLESRTPVGCKPATNSPTEQRSLATFVQILETLAHELGTDTSELEDDVLFADLGIDSLLTISILSRLTEVVSQQLPAALFIQYPTVADLRSYFHTLSQVQQLQVIHTTQHDGKSTIDDESAAHVTPDNDISGVSIGICRANQNPLTEAICNIIAQEVGVNSQEISADATLAELGVDSLLSLSVLARVREETGMVLASTFLYENPTFSAIEYALRDTPVSRSAGREVIEMLTTPSLSATITPPKSDAVTSIATAVADTKIWSASSILLQGSPSRKEPCLFLIPDGSGSPSSYVGLPSLDRLGAVYGLCSPFLAEPKSFDMALQDVVALYVEEILRLQPSGPYHIGGWSIGGICAFEAAAQLIREHAQEVSSLILIDAPCPTILPPLPVQDVDFLQSIGAFETLTMKPTRGCGKPAMGPRGGLRDHFVGSIRALEQYVPRAITGAEGPKSVTILWAGQGVWQSLGEEMRFFTAGVSKSAHPTTSWLMDPRPSYGTCGWEELLPGSNFTCHAITGDHFSMMRKPGIKDMGPKMNLTFTTRA